MKTYQHSLIERIPASVKNAAALILVVVAYGIVGTMDYEDAVAMEAARTTTQVAAATPSK
jgi:hypothetical protein